MTKEREEEVTGKRTEAKTEDKAKDIRRTISFLYNQCLYDQCSS